MSRAAEAQGESPGKRRVGRPSREGRNLDSGVERRDEIVREAARLFGEQGYELTSMRDIASAAGILPGSIYYHFPSKEALLLEVHGKGMALLTGAARAIAREQGDPWRKLERLAVAHCSALLNNAGLMRMVVPRFPDSLGSSLSAIKAQRDEYEQMVMEIIAELDLPESVDRRLFRLQFLGALNWSQSWYRSGGPATPAEIGAHLVRLLRPDR